MESYDAWRVVKVMMHEGTKHTRALGEQDIAMKGTKLGNKKFS